MRGKTFPSATPPSNPLQLWSDTYNMKFATGTCAAQWHWVPPAVGNHRPSRPQNFFFFLIIPNRNCIHDSGFVAETVNLGDAEVPRRYGWAIFQGLIIPSFLPGFLSFQHSRVYAHDHCTVGLGALAFWGESKHTELQVGRQDPPKRDQMCWGKSTSELDLEGGLGGLGGRGIRDGPGEWAGGILSLPSVPGQ